MSDSDQNGIEDGEEDSDEDGLKNKEELEIGTDPMNEDTDGDGLNDFEEINTYGTDPVNEDSDGDEVSDKKEIEIGTDPLKKEESFHVTEQAEGDGKVQASVTIDLNGEQVETLTVKPTGTEFLFPKEMPGYIGNAYEFSVENASVTSGNASVKLEGLPDDYDAVYTVEGLTGTVSGDTPVSYTHLTLPTTSRV